VDGKWPKLMLMGAVTSCRLLYDLTTGTGSPRLAPAVLQCSLLVCALLALIGSAVIYATDR
jgi:hypothetical protein